MRRKAGRAQKFLITIGGYQRAKCEGACECDVEVDGEETRSETTDVHSVSCVESG
jgi:hypothetical protein